VFEGGALVRNNVNKTRALPTNTNNVNKKEPPYKHK
jgi:hypothetical protein